MNHPSAAPPLPAATASFVQVFVATSLDGFVAREDGSIDWLTAFDARIPPGEDCGWRAFIDGLDALVMGRATFAQVMRFDPWPYGQLPVVAMSRQPLEVPQALADRVTVTTDSPNAVLDMLARRGLRRVGVDGGRLVQAFLCAGLVDELTVTTVPVLIGRGRPLFGPLPADLPLDPLQVRHFPFGLVQVTWRLRR
jgi:dihydrofolate reductase